MKVALLIAQSRVSPVFETTSSWLLFDVTKSECLASGTHHFQAHNEQEMINELITNNIELLICGAIPYYLEKNLVNQGCNVFSFVSGEAQEVMQALRLNQLDKPKFKMPGCQKRKQRGKNIFCQRTTTQ